MLTKQTHTVKVKYCPYPNGITSTELASFLPSFRTFLLSEPSEGKEGKEGRKDIEGKVLKEGY
jgi:hypothetical protein